MTFLRFGTKQERLIAVKQEIGLKITDNVCNGVLADFIDDVDQYLNLSAKELFEKMKDPKDGPSLIDLAIINEDLMQHLLKKTAGTRARKSLFIDLEENHGRFPGARPLDEVICNTHNGIYLIELCEDSTKLKDFLLKNAEQLKIKGLIDDEVIKDINNIVSRKQPLYISFR